MTTSFSDFALAPAVLRGLDALGFVTPTPIQEQAIPLLLAKRDAICMAKTGSGKTFAFGLPLLTMLKRSNKPQALVVCPTRELAQQIREAIASVSLESPLRTVVIYGGVGLGPQEKQLRDGADLVVGTPGRLKDLLARGSLDLSGVKVLVLDEADEMLDKGFRREIEFLLDRLPSREQTLIFSATMPPEIEAIARKHLKDPAMVKLTQQQAVPTEIAHHYVRVPSDMRLDALVALLRSEAPERALIFTRTKRETKILARKLEAQAGLVCGFLNGNMSQNARDTMMSKFRAGEFRFLVATDVAARGLDVEGLSHVFHFAVPTVVETYIHRSGRTGRAGNEGMTIILVTPDDESDFKAISKRIKIAELKIDVPRLPRPEGAAPVSRGPRTQRSLDPSLDDGGPDHPPQRRGRAQPSAAPRNQSDESRLLPPRPHRGQGPQGPVRNEQRDRGPARPDQPIRDRAPARQELSHQDGMRSDASRNHRAQPPAGGPGERTGDRSGRAADSPRGARGDGQGRSQDRPQQDRAWRAFKMPLKAGHEHSPESFRTWLSARARVASAQVRSVKLHADHATFEVEGPAVDSFLSQLRGAGR